MSRHKKFLRKWVSKFFISSKFVVIGAIHLNWDLNAFVGVVRWRNIFSDQILFFYTQTLFIRRPISTYFNFNLFIITGKKTTTREIFSYVVMHIQIKGMSYVKFFVWCKTCEIYLFIFYFTILRYIFFDLEIFFC